MSACHEFIDAEKDTYRVTDMCRWLHVSRDHFRVRGVAVAQVGSPPARG
ncbi:hypothetical protein [Streptomyces boncukensis]|uniref:Uncharacterized protein n=1 Tax=Streptomyces boncukensis TaxID=2711219 RepID=A0A6G4WQS3_9ACTN|nr:hypothetical protein [Streptomyces boncukensis]NGO66990.1 hypothetical protein [Streptomyces boncukensis]